MMFDISWMNWEGWRWVSLTLVTGIAFFCGWSSRGSWDRIRVLRARLAEMRAAQAKAAAEMEGPDDGR